MVHGELGSHKSAKSNKQYYFERDGAFKFLTNVNLLRSPLSEWAGVTKKQTKVKIQLSTPIQFSGSDTSTSLLSFSLKWKLALTGSRHKSLSAGARPKLGASTVIFTA
jgi:hypothetical protein